MVVKKGLEANTAARGNQKGLRASIVGRVKVGRSRLKKRRRVFVSGKEASPHISIRAGVLVVPGR